METTLNDIKDLLAELSKYCSSMGYCRYCIFEDGSNLCRIVRSDPDLDEILEQEGYVNV